EAALGKGGSVSIGHQLTMVDLELPVGPPAHHGEATAGREGAFVRDHQVAHVKRAAEAPVALLRVVDGERSALSGQGAQEEAVPHAGDGIFYRRRRPGSPGNAEYADRRQGERHDLLCLRYTHEALHAALAFLKV